MDENREAPTRKPEAEPGSKYVNVKVNGQVLFRSPIWVFFGRILKTLEMKVKCYLIGRMGVKCISGFVRGRNSVNLWKRTVNDKRWSWEPMRFCWTAMPLSETKQPMRLFFSNLFYFWGLVWFFYPNFCVSIRFDCQLGMEDGDEIDAMKHHGGGRVKWVFSFLWKMATDPANWFLCCGENMNPPNMFRNDDVLDLVLPCSLSDLPRTCKLFCV